MEASIEEVSQAMAKAIIEPATLLPLLGLDPTTLLLSPNAPAEVVSRGLPNFKLSLKEIPGDASFNN